MDSVPEKLAEISKHIQAAGQLLLSLDRTTEEQQGAIDEGIKTLAEWQNNELHAIRKVYEKGGG